MNKFIIALFIGTSINIMAQEATPKKLIDIEDYNPQSPITEPIGIVDKFGNIEWKNPPRKKEPPKKIEPQPLENKKVTSNFIKGKDSAFNFEINGSFMGQLTGGSLLGYYQSNKWSYGASFKYYMYSSIDDTSFSNLMGTVVIQYHFMPRWYTNSPSHKKFDLGVNFQLGYNMVGKSLNNQMIKSSPIIGVGAFSSYPISENIKGIIRLDNFSTGSKAIGSSAAIGISFGF